MRTTNPLALLLLAAILLTSLTGYCAFAQDKPGGDPKPKEGEVKQDDPKPEPEPKPKPEPKPEPKKEEATTDPQVPAVPGMVFIPKGPVNPGCTWPNFKERHQGGAKLKAALVYDVWGSLTGLMVPELYVGRYEVTNAQWKLYLDREFRVQHKCTGQDTLFELAKRYIKFRDEALESEWRSIYGLNARAIMTAIQKADTEAAKKAAADGKPKPKPQWNPKWTLVNPDPAHKETLSRVFLPKDLELVFYSHRVPQHWYGWCALTSLRVGREFCDPRKPPGDAFVVPAEDKVLAELKLREKDFSRHPIRDLSANEILAFVEWAGCDLPSEYEWERMIRGGRPNTDQHPFPGPWDHRAQRRIFAWFDNIISRKGPLAVDDERMKPGDTKQGARHVLGNVWELTRTFWDFHPFVAPKPPEPISGLFNYALTAKGGSFGDGWQMIQTSTRTGQIGAGLELALNNRADTLGFRLARHPKPGQDLLRHSILRLTYERGRGQWNNILPLHFNMFHMAGVDKIHITETEGPYDYVKAKAEGIAFAPVWISKLNSNGVKLSRNRWRQKKLRGGKDYYILGALRSDVPIRAGVRQNAAAANKLVADRAEYAKLKEEFDRQQKNKKKKRKKKKKKGEEEEKPIVLPPKPPDPDRFELATDGREIGLWREGTVAPGEWFVVYYYGFIGLANKTLLMPPDALFIVDKKAVEQKRQITFPTIFKLNREKSSFTLSFSVEEQLDLKKPEQPPDAQNSDQWAWCEIHPNGWRRRKKPSRKSWVVTMDVPVVKGALDKFK